MQAEFKLLMGKITTLYFEQMIARDPVVLQNQLNRIKESARRLLIHAANRVHPINERELDHALPTIEAVHTMQTYLFQILDTNIDPEGGDVAFSADFVRDLERATLEVDARYAAYEPQQKRARNEYQLRRDILDPDRDMPDSD